MSRRRLSADAGVWTLIVVIAFVALALWAGPVHRLAAVHAPTRVPWVVVAGLFALAEANVVHVYRRGDAHSFSLSEVPLVVGLFFLSPTQLLLAALVGTGLALAVARRQRGKKLAFNLSQFGFSCAVALVVFHAVPKGTGVGPSAWPAAVAAAAASALAGIVAVQAVIAVSQRRFDRAAAVEVVILAAIGTVANASLALLTVTLVWDRPVSVWLLVVPMVVVLAAYRAYLGERDRRRGLEFLYESTQILQRSSDVERATADILRHACDMFRAESAELVLYPGGDGSRALRAAVDAGGGVEQLHPIELDPVHLVSASVASDRNGILLEGDEHGRRTLRRKATGRAVVVPLEDERGPTGTLRVGHRLDDVTTFGSEDLRLLKTLANHVQAALDNGQLQRSLTELRDRQHELRRQALHDPLTGLANRTLFAERVGSALEDGVGSIAVLFVDLDDFKGVNDTFGHQAGDRLLSAVATRIRSCLRPADLAARLGGDEFAVLLDAGPAPTAGAAASRVADRIQDLLRLPLMLPCGAEVVVRASIGVATAEAGTVTVEQLVADADAAMYRAKASGKGHWELASHN
ncbi:MAG: diguanylate cyclase/phosphodiesterase [Acidimicrobiales bacterium]|nr:diguanylate cyclase/phosphodiesterase [Acidimicrobiales bacterium]